MWLVARGSKAPTCATSRYASRRVEESPKNVDCCRGEPLAGRFGKGTLKGTSHRAGDKVRNGVCRKNAPKEVRHKPKPIHDAELLLSSSEMISCVDPVSPRRGKTFLMLYSCAILAGIGHRIECEGHVEPLLVGLACRRLNATRCRHSGHNHLGNASRLELVFKIRRCECAPASLGDDDIARLPIQLRQKIGPPLGKRYAAARTLFRPARRPSRHIDQYDGKLLRTENIDQGTRSVDDARRWDE